MILEAAGVEHQRQTRGADIWYQLARCPFHDDGPDFECGVGERAKGAMGKCFHNRGIGKGWHDFKVALGLPEWRDVDPDRPAPSVAGKPSAPAASTGPNGASARTHQEQARGIDAVDLLALDLPKLRMIVPDLLPEGTTALASPPKVGKSCLIYQIAVEVAIGGGVLGRRVTPGSVLYLALEDGQRRGQARLRAALHDRTLPRDRLEVRWSAPAIGRGPGGAASGMARCTPRCRDGRHRHPPEGPTAEHRQARSV